MDLKGTSICLFLFALTLGCSPEVTSEQTEQRWLYFLADGETKKIVIISRLGKPSAQFQGGRILTYRLKIDHKGVLRPVSQSLEEFFIDRKLFDVNSMYSLVLIFDEKEILRRHSLVNIIP
jgi:hypothetical protein